MSATDELVKRRDEIESFMQTISGMLPGDGLSELCDGFLYSFPPDVALTLAVKMNWYNPFYLPDIPESHFANLRISADEFAEILLRLRMTASRQTSVKILIASAPKSASIFIYSSLIKALNLPGASLTVAGENTAELGALTREAEFDEIAILRSSLWKDGFVAHQHMQANPYSAELMNIYQIKPIVTFRNIFDTLVSYDDMRVQDRLEQPDINHFFNDGYPDGFEHMEREDRLMFVALTQAQWLVQFYVSWKKCEARGFIKPLWISYDDDFMVDRKRTIARLIRYIGEDKVDPERLVKALFDSPKSGTMRFNKGVSGRGQDLPDKVRDLVMTLAKPYRDEIDMVPLLGE